MLRVVQILAGVGFGFMIAACILRRILCDFPEKIRHATAMRDKGLDFDHWQSQLSTLQVTNTRLFRAYVLAMILSGLLLIVSINLSKKILQ